MRPEAASGRWAGLPDPDEAAPRAIAAYLRAYGPAQIESFGKWLAGGWFGQRRLRAWFDALGDRVAQVDIEGTTAYVLAEDVDELLSTRRSNVVRLLPGFDQYVLGPGTGDGHVVRAARRTAVSKQSGWIAPVVVAGGVVCGTWEVDRTELRLTWFPEAGSVPKGRLHAEVSRLATIMGRELRLHMGPA